MAVAMDMNTHTTRRQQVWSVVVRILFVAALLLALLDCIQSNMHLPTKIVAIGMLVIGLSSFGRDHVSK